VYDCSVVVTVCWMRYITGIVLHSPDNVRTHIPCFST